MHVTNRVIRSGEPAMPAQRVGALAKKPDGGILEVSVALAEQTIAYVPKCMGGGAMEICITSQDDFSHEFHRATLQRDEARRLRDWLITLDLGQELAEAV